MSKLNTKVRMVCTCGQTDDFTTTPERSPWLCDHCHARGGTPKCICPRCHGNGYETFEDDDVPFPARRGQTVVSRMQCTKCLGAQEVAQEWCSSCGCKGCDHCDFAGYYEREMED